jgi:HK97 family phage prohead protease
MRITLQRSVSTLEIKSLDEERREIEGIASTPTPDRVGDVIDPQGLSYQKETPLLMNHKSDQPVGTVTFGKATPKGLPFKAKIAKVDEAGAVKDRTDEAWHSVKHGLVKGVSIGFMPSEGKHLPSGGIHYAKAAIHELSLTSVPCNPEARITAFKSIEFQIHKQKDMNMIEPIRLQDKTIIRAAIAKAVAGSSGSAALYAESRWGAHSAAAAYVKAQVSPMTAGTDANPQGLAVGTISRSQFVQAVFSSSILGQMQGLVQVPAMTRVNVEASPVSGAFFGEGLGMPIAQGNVGVYLTDKRKAGIAAVVSEELVKMTDETAEATITGILVRALSRAIDNAFVGSQARDTVSPEGLAAAATQATSFGTGVGLFTGDIKQACVLLNPQTALTLRSPTETQITGYGGYYSGMPAICSYGVPVGQVFIVDATRVIAYIGDAIVEAYNNADVYNLAGVAPNVPVNLFQTAQVALAAQQYIDWQLVPGAAVQITLPQS